MSEVEIPHSDMAERAVLGAILLDGAKLGDADALAPDDFHRRAHARVFQAMRDLRGRNEPVDLVTVGEETLTDVALVAVGGFAYLSDLRDGIPRHTSVAHYAEIVRERAARRACIRLGREIADEAALGDEPVDSLMARFLDRLRAIPTGGPGSTWRSIGDLAVRVLDDYEARQARGGALGGLPTGFADLDDLIDGFHPGELIVLAATTSSGKTALAMGVAAHVSRLGKPVGVVSLEMPDTQIAGRVVFAEARVDQQRARKGRLTDEDWRKLTGTYPWLKSAPLFVDESTSATMPQIASRAKALHRDKGLSLLIVDYAGLIVPSGRAGSREEAMTAIGRQLKQLARDLNAPVLVLSQVNSEGDKRQGSPHMVDVRESKALTHEADVLFMLHREEARLRREGKRDDQIPEDVKGVADLHVMKQRSGPPGHVGLKWHASHARFSGLARRSQEMAEPADDWQSRAANDRDDPPGF